MTNASRENQRRTRVTICWTGISGYLAAGWRALQAIPELDVTYCVQLGSRGFDPSTLRGLRNFHAIDGARQLDVNGEVDLICSTNPDVLVVSGWNCPAHRRAVRDRRLAGAASIMAMDTPWIGGPKQLLATVALRRYARRMSLVVTACERSRRYAERLGVDPSRIKLGTYCADVPSFARAAELRGSRGSWPRRFLFAGRLIHQKGVDVLLGAYSRYREAVEQPWPLTICGKGPLETLVAGRPGVSHVGFVQPSDLPEMFSQHGAFVLPSRHEPWGVVIAEAAASGMPVLCSDRCGAGMDLVRDCSNGLVFAADDPEALSKALLHVHRHEPMLAEYGAVSREIVAPYAPGHWAQRWAGYCTSLAKEPR